MPAFYRPNFQPPSIEKRVERRFSISSESSIEQESESEADFLKSSDEEESDEFEEAASIASNYDFMKNDLTFITQDEEKEKVGSKRGRTFQRRSTNKENKPFTNTEVSRKKRLSETPDEFNLKLATDELEAELSKELEKVGISKPEAPQLKPSFLSFNFDSNNNSFAVGSNQKTNKTAKRKTNSLKTSPETASLSDYLSKMNLESKKQAESSEMKNIIHEKMEKLKLNEKLPTPRKPKINLRRRKGISLNNKGFKSLKHSRKEKALLKEQNSLPSATLLKTFNEEKENQVLQKINILVSEKKYSKIVLLSLTTEPTDDVKDIISKALLLTGETSNIEIKHDLRKRAESLHIRINKRITSADFAAESLSSLHLYLKELKTIETKSISTDFYTAVLLLYKMVSQNDIELNRKLKQSIKTCLKNWINSLPGDISCLFLQQQYTKNTGIKHILLLNTVSSLLLQHGYYEELSFFLSEVNKCFETSLLIQSLLRELYLHITTKDIDKFINRFNTFVLEESIKDMKCIHSSQTVLESCKGYVEDVNKAISQFCNLHQQLSYVLRVKEEAKTAFVGGKKSIAKDLYTNILNLDSLQKEYFLKLKSIFYSNRAACLISLCKFEAALSDCEQAILCDRTNHKAKLRKSKVLSKQYKFDEAISVLKQALKQHPEEKSVLDRIREVVLEKELHRQRKEDIKRQQAKSNVNMDSSIQRELTVSELISCSDYYRVLGVSRAATSTEIKKRYHKLALKYHPDKAINVNTKASYEEAFKKINSCFDTLKDNSKRKLYDLKNGYSTFRTPTTRRTYKKYETQGYYSCGARPTNFSKQYSYSGYS